MKISFSLSSRVTAIASTYTGFEPLLAQLGFGSLYDQPFGTGVLRAAVRAEDRGNSVCFLQSGDDWSGGREWSRDVRSKVISAGAELTLQERSRDGKSVFTGTWQDRKYEVVMRTSRGCKESAYFVELHVQK